MPRKAPELLREKTIEERADSVATHNEQVDMLAQAREVQWDAGAFAGPNSIKLVAPAKVNLFLGVGGKRADGLHEVVNVMQALALHDVLYVRHDALAAEELAEAATDAKEAGESLAVAGAEGDIVVDIVMVDKTGDAATAAIAAAPVRDNLAFKAIDVLARLANRTGPQRFVIRIEKHIPVQAGLGGGSSDAAAVLRAAARFWSIEDEALLEEAARRVGSDVTFFLHGGCALFEGAGERFTWSLAPTKASLVVVKPTAGVSTAEAYAAFDADPLSVPENLLDRIRQAPSADQVPLFNNLQNAAERLSPAIEDVREWLAEHEAVEPRDVLMSGSGAAVFAFTGDFAAACAIAGEAQKRGLWARATTGSSLMAARLP